jgi:hypothetical protein
LYDPNGVAIKRCIWFLYKPAIPLELKKNAVVVDARGITGL